MNMLYLFSKMFGFVIHTTYKVQRYFQCGRLLFVTIGSRICSAFNKIALKYLIILATIFYMKFLAKHVFPLCK